MIEDFGRAYLAFRGMISMRRQYKPGLIFLVCVVVIVILVGVRGSPAVPPQTLGLIILAAVVVTGAAILVSRVVGNWRAASDEQTNPLVSRLSNVPGVTITRHYISSDESSCIGLDEKANIILIAFADSSEIKRFHGRDVLACEILEDGELLTDDTPGFLKVKRLDLRVTVKEEKGAYLFKLLDTGIGVRRGDPVYLHALRVGNRMQEAISALMQPSRRNDTLAAKTQAGIVRTPDAEIREELIDYAERHSLFKE